LTRAIVLWHLVSLSQLVVQCHLKMAGSFEKNVITVGNKVYCPQTMINLNLRIEQILDGKGEN
jgi:hypothetical protein